MLVLDRETHQLYVAPYAVSHTFLESQWVQLIPQAMGQFARVVEELQQRSTWRVPTNEEITRQMQRQTQLMAELCMWLDAQNPDRNSEVV